MKPLYRKTWLRFLPIVFNLERANQLSPLPDKDLADFCPLIEPYEVTKNHKLLLERISLRGIARVTGVSWSWLQNYVNNKLAAVPRQIKVSDKPKGKLVRECDEMWSLVFSKTIKFYIWLAIDRKTREIIGCYARR